jgi:TonB-linked SusC/RagA family outer membrane protein
MRKLVMLMMGLLLSLSTILAQSRVISGKVLDEKGNPLSGASVQVRGTNIGTTTNAEGVFTINVPSTAKELVVSSVNYVRQEIKIGSGNVYNVSLKLSDDALDEVIVTGYTQEKKSRFTGAASVVKAKEIETVPILSFDQVLQGRVPGLMINSGSGQPGTAARVAIRGTQSISGAFAQPLYIVDGVPLEAAEFASINANDFESVTVLKDAAAAALYGSRAGQGVIVVTTKRGKAGKTEFSYRTQFGFTQVAPWVNFDMMNTQERLAYEERNRIAAPGWQYSRLNPLYGTLPATAPGFAPSQARHDFLLDSFRNIQNNPLALLFRQGLSQQHEFNIRGGSEGTKFFISGAYVKQEGIELRSMLERYTTRLNLDHRSGKFTMQFNTAVGASVSRFSEGEFIGNSARNSFQIAWRGMPYENPFLPDGSLNFGVNTGLTPRLFANTLEGIQNTEGRANQLKINTGLLLSYEIMPNVTVKNQFGIDFRNDRWLRWFNPTSLVGSQQQFNRGLNSEANELQTTLINTSSINYSNTFKDKHQFSAGAFFEAVRTWDRMMGLTNFGLDPRLPQTGQGAGNAANGFPPNATSAKSGFGIRSFFATAKYSYDDKYSLNTAIRRDGTSRIVNPDNREITSWSVGFTWNAIKEKFVDDLKVFSDAQLRISYGITPNIASIPGGAYNGPLVSIPNYRSAQTPSFGASTYAGSGILGLAPSTPGNPDLAIENVRKFNVGADFSFAKNRIRLQADYYINRTVDLFINQPLPRTSGFTGAQINAGVMSNKGLELNLSVDVVKTKDIDLTLGANHAINKNTIEDLGVVEEFELGTFLIRRGLPYGTHYTFQYLGADPATGRPMFETQDGGITTNFAQAGRFTRFGQFMPNHVGGFTLDFRFKRFSLSTLFSYQFDVTRYNNIESWVARGNGAFAPAVNQVRRLLTDQWQQPGDVKFFNAYAFERNFTSSDVNSSAFLRFRNINLAYQIPEITINGTRVVKSARFYVQAQNLFIWSPWRGPDPEDNNNISLSEFPNPRIITMGLDINF